MYSTKPLNKVIKSSELIVWPHEQGIEGEKSILPIHKKIPEASLNDHMVYQFCALADAIRAGRPRERLEAKKLLFTILEQVKNAE